MHRLPADTLRTFVADLLAAAGTDLAESRLVAESLIDANLRGHDSHGVLRVREYLDQLGIGELVSPARFTIVHETPAAFVADAHFGFGQVQCRELVHRTCARAETAGVACGALRHCGHVGRLGEWVELAARAGFAAFLSVNDNGVEMTVAPPGGIAPRLSTNPLALAVPTAAEPLVLDMSTSAVAHGKVKAARLAGMPCPPGWIQDPRGEASTDPHVLLADPPGTLLPLGGNQAHKGFGLALLLDILISGLTGGTCPPHPGGQLCNNVLLVAWAPDRFAGTAHLVSEAAKLCQFVRATPTRPGVDRIQLPGDRSRDVARQRTAEGIPLPGDTWTELVRLAERWGVPLPGS